MTSRGQGAGRGPRCARVRGRRRSTTGSSRSSRRSPRVHARLFLGRQTQPLLQHQPHLVGGGAPEGATGNVVLGLHLRPVLGHRGVLLGLVGGGRVDGPRADPAGLGRRRVGALDPAPDLVPVLVEEDHDRDGLVAVVQEDVSQVGILVAEEHAQVAVRHRLADVGEQRRVTVDVPAPVLGQHQGVPNLADAAEELALVRGQRRLRVVVFGASPGVAHLGHVVLPGQAFGEALCVEGNLQLGHVVLSSVGVRRPRHLYNKRGAEDRRGSEDRHARRPDCAAYIDCGRNLSVRPPTRRWLIVAALFVVPYGIATPLAAYGVFLPVLAEAFAWSRGAISAALSINLMLGGLAGFGIGALADRHGPRVMLVLTVTLAGAAFALVSTVDALWQLYLFVGVMGGVGMSSFYLLSAATIEARHS